ncbi:MAG TPA: DUF1667 domain-containing protein [Candidatus Merdisoma merdipullorum]|nr:DUF1667 domain-containing protein [Candidatus Merdisoma merdipullorum]
MTKELICIECPLGCRLLTVLENERMVSVEGNGCGRGKIYAAQEAVQPVRILTDIMKAEGCKKPFAVRTDKAVPKDLLLQCAAELKRIHPRPPISAGDVIIPHILGTDANVIATQDFDKE